MARGGKREGAGRPPGVPNKATAEIKDLARQYTGDALTTLAGIMKSDEQPAAARVSACKELLDRAYGKAPQALTGEGGGPITTKIIREFIGAPNTDR